MRSTALPYTRVFDCASNKMFLLDAGTVPDGYGVGWRYDAKRKLVYSLTTGGEAWVSRVDPGSSRKPEKPPE